MSEGTKVQNARMALCTMNNPDKYLDGLTPMDYLESISKHDDVCYVNGQLEKGNETGTVHLQYYVHLTKKQRASGFQKIVKQSDIRLVKVDNGASSYCLKE